MDLKDNRDAYCLLVAERLGVGCFGKTFKCIHKTTKRVLAAKLVDKEYLDSLKLYREIPILEGIRMASCQNLIEFVEFIPCEPDVWILMEYCNSGNLEELLNERLRSWWLSAGDIKHIFQQIARGMKVLHDKSIIHRDLKLSNILMHCPNESTGLAVTNLVVKITDFGLSIMLSEEGKLKTSTDALGSFAYQAPECLEVPKGGYDAKVDLWSIGVMLYQCAMKMPLTSAPLPFKGDHSELIKLYKTNCTPVFSSWWSLFGRTNELRQLINALLTVNAAHRIEFDHFFTHPFLSD